MQNVYDLTDEQGFWLQRIFESRENPGLLDHLSVPAGVQDALVKQRLVRRWRDGSLEITLGGIREVAHRSFAYDDAQIAEAEPA